MAAKSRTMAQQKTKEAYCFIVPAFIYMILVLGYPIVYNIILSLKDVNVKNLKSGTSVFVGLQNYIDLFHDPTFLLVLRNTFIFTIACLIFQFTIGFAFAMFFNQKFKLAGPIRGLILVSYMMPMAVTGLLGKILFYSVLSMTCRKRRNYHRNRNSRPERKKSFFQEKQRTHQSQTAVYTKFHCGKPTIVVARNTVPISGCI